MPENNSLIRAPIAVVLAWLIPGLGHLFLGHRTRGAIFLVMITLTFWTGVAVGGVKCVDLHKPAQKNTGGDTRSWWFFAQILNGGYAVTSYAIGQWSTEAGYLAWPAGDVASVYTGVAGLLNLLIIIDALSRAEGLPSAPRSRRRPVSSSGPPGTGGRPSG